MNTATVGQKVDDILDSVVSSDFIRRLKPTMNELNNTMAQMAQKDKIWHITQTMTGSANANIQENLNGIVPQLVQSFNLGDDFTKVAKGTTQSNVEESFEKLHAMANGNATLDKKIDYMRKQVDEAIKNAGSISGDTVKDTVGTINYVGNIPKAYFGHPDKQVRSTRINTAIGAYAAATVGTRIMSGGNLTTDSYGRKDIAGVPFI